MDSAIICSLISAAVTIGNVVFTTVMSSRLEKKRRTKQIESGLQSLLRAEIIRSHEKYMDKGYCPVYAREALGRIYESYHGLGGNGTMTELYNQVIALPTDKEGNHEN